jgi:uncharacterized delta-60 repeat protein
MRPRYHFGFLILACGVSTCRPLVRGQVAGSVDLSYNPVIGGPGSFARVVAAMPQPDGKILVGGIFSQVQGQARHTVARLLPNGIMEPATSFHPDVPGSSIGMKLAVQSDGRFLLAGPGFLYRLEPNGSRESTTTFNIGTGVTHTNGNPAIIYGIALQPDGRIIICGNFGRVNGRDIAGVARLLPNGSVQGIADFNPAGGTPNMLIQCTAVQPDGKILVGGGFTIIGGQARRSLARLLPNGAVESTATFNATAEYESGNPGLVWAIVVQPDGKMLVAGQFQRINGQPRNGIARLLSDGSVDATFQPAWSSIVFATALQADGKVLIASPFVPRLGRLLPDGSLESTATFNPGSGPWASISPDFSSLTLQADGKILVGGTIDNVNGTPRTNLARLHNDPATQRLAATTDRIHWLRGGTAPEVHQVTFEHSATGGAPWTLLGQGTPVAGGWELSGISVPALGRIRARGRTVGGQHNGSLGLVENILDPATALSITHFAIAAPQAGGSGKRLLLTADGGIGAATAIMELQASVALNEWSTVATTRADAAGRAAFDFTDSDGAWQFYRVRVP